MSYMDAQRARLGKGKRFALKIQNRTGDETGETLWMNATLDQVDKVFEILSQNDRYYTIREGDIGRATVFAFGQTWSVADFIGKVLPGDVGKRVYRKTDNAGVADLLQVESDAQRDKRVKATP